jgi:hypothetical protein
MAKVPCVRIETMAPKQKRAYVLADNKLERYPYSRQHFWPSWYP